MKKIFTAILLLFLSVNCFCAIGANTAWEFRATAANDNLNGGGYNPDIAGAGTDYTLQDAAQISLTDITCVSGEVTINSTAAPFTAAMVGNAMQFTSAGSHTAGFYFVTTYISATQVKLDSSPYTGGGTSSGGTARLGGALYVPTDALWEVVIGGNTVWMKNGTYTLTGAITIASTSATRAAPIKIYGYNSTRGDTATLTNRPTIACGANVLTARDYWIFRNIIFTGTGTNVLTKNTSVSATAINCKITNSSGSADRAALGGRYWLANECELISTNGFGSNQTVGPSTFLNSYFHDSKSGVAGTVKSNIIGCIFGKMTSVGADIGDVSVIKNSIFYACTPNAILLGSASPESSTVEGCIFKDNGTAINSTASNSIAIIDRNIFNGNAVDVTNCAKGAGNLATDPKLKNPGAGDFTLESGSPALNAGWNFSNSGLTGAYRWNIGVDQNDLTSGTRSWAY